ncbi:MAG: zf-HC2 domain-containing protein [Acidobacteriota bacterium]|nr:zf-HC2 domain-containing protein [Acidobacteriota bacterium]
MKDILSNNCGRGELLIAYLYGEAAPTEARGFEQHLEECAACRHELAAFGFVRESVGEWRAVVQSQTPALALAGLASVEQQALRSPSRPARDWRLALVALRQFFALSPSWLRAGTVTAALVFSVLAALAVLRTAGPTARPDDNITAASDARQQPAVSPPEDATTTQDGASQPEIEQLTAQLAAARLELDQTRARLSEAEERNETVIAAAAAKNSVKIEPASKNESTRKRRVVVNNAVTAQSRRGLSERDNDDLPSLLDLLGETD